MKNNNEYSIVIVSSGQPSANPRMVKEATALHQAGFAVTVVYCPLSPWADEFDKKLFEDYRDIKWVKAGYSSVNQPLSYACSRLRQKLYRYLFEKTGRLFFAERAFVLFAQELLSAGEKSRADLYIGHNVGALPVIVKLAKKFNAKSAFDFEDFHRGEDVANSLHTKIVECIEAEYVPQIDYASSASPFISAAYQKIFASIKFITINNCFPLQYASKEIKDRVAKSLKLFWFSQFIGEKRGLETVIEAIGKTGLQDVQLHLLGNCDKNKKKYLESLANEYGLVEGQLQFLSPVPLDQIAAIGSRYDIGIASEVPELLNRELCLTNKIFIYLLAGNAILFSDTKAQESFLKANPRVGFCYKHDDANALSKILRLYYNEPDVLINQRKAALQLAKEKMNWEQEKDLLLQAVNGVLGQE